MLDVQDYWPDVFNMRINSHKDYLNCLFTSISCRYRRNKAGRWLGRFAMAYCKLCRASAALSRGRMYVFSYVCHA